MKLSCKEKTTILFKNFGLKFASLEYTKNAVEWRNTLATVVFCALSLYPNIWILVKWKSYFNNEPNIHTDFLSSAKSNYVFPWNQNSPKGRTYIIMYKKSLPMKFVFSLVIFVHRFIFRILIVCLIIAAVAIIRSVL